MKAKRGMITMIVLIVVVVLLFVGYNIYRHPATFRDLSDNSLSETETESLRAEIAAMDNKDILVAYFSYSGTTQNVANALSEELDADLFEIRPSEEYSNVYMQSNREIRRNERPALADTVENMDDYEIVFIGYPVWWHATPAPINTFLESYDFSGKLVIPFCTSGGSDIDETMPTFLDSCEGVAVYGARRMSGTSGLQSWLDDLNLNLGGQENAQIVQPEAAQMTSLDAQNSPLSKFAYVYLPYGYDESDTGTRYNIFYLMHGGGGTAERYLGGEGAQGNFYYGVVEGGIHNNTYMNHYIYNALPQFFQNQSRGESV